MRLYVAILAQGHATLTSWSCGQDALRLSPRARYLETRPNDSWPLRHWVFPYMSVIGKKDRFDKSMKFKIRFEMQHGILCFSFFVAIKTCKTQMDGRMALGCRRCRKKRKKKFLALVKRLHSCPRLLLPCRVVRCLSNLVWTFRVPSLQAQTNQRMCAPFQKLVGRRWWMRKHLPKSSTAMNLKQVPYR